MQKYSLERKQAVLRKMAPFRECRRRRSVAPLQVRKADMPSRFGSTAPFSRAYKTHFGRTPRQDRQAVFE